MAIDFRNAHGIRQQATLCEDELEQFEGRPERRARLEQGDRHSRLLGEEPRA